MTTELYVQARRLLAQKRFSEALSIYERLGNVGDVQCQIFAGWMINEGLGSPKDGERALGWFRRAADQNSSEGAFYCGRVMVTKGRYAEAEPWFSLAAQKDYSPAVLWMGILRTRGLIANADFETGVRYVRKAIGLGNLLAQRELVRILLSGRYGLVGTLKGLMLLPIILIRVLFKLREGPSPDLQS